MKAYSQLYKHGKTVGKPFFYESKRKGETIEQFKRRVNAENNRWNKIQKTGYSVKTIKIGKTLKPKAAPIKRRTTSWF